MVDVRSLHNTLYNQLNGYDSDADYYDPDRGIRACEEIAELFKQHIAKDACEAEIEIMKGEKINNRNASFYDILRQSISQLVIYAKNVNIVQTLKSDDNKTKFPIYGSMIDSQFRGRVDKKVLLEQGNKLLHSLFESFPQLTSHCTAKIFSCLSNRDLRILIDACKPLNSPNTYISDAENTLVVKGRHTE